jgi:hypothetical protein
MSTIPDDIFSAAADVWSTLPKESAGIIAIARAILAERERCASIAEECPVHSLLWRDSIANAIRGGN